MRGRVATPVLTVSMPTWRTPQLRDAVDSVLNQTFRDLTLVVVADGDESAWQLLDDITDPRLIRFSLPQNRGRYWADAVTLRACETEYWTPHDADDWSHPERYEKQVGPDVSFTTCRYFWLDGTDTHDPVRIRFVPPQKHRLKTIARYPAGVYKTQLAQRVGILPTCRGSFDTAFVNLVWKTTVPVVVDEELYHVRKRHHSLTTDPHSQHGSDWRRQERFKARRAYDKAWNLPADRMFEAMRSTDSIEDKVNADVQRLREVMHAVDNTHRH